MNVFKTISKIFTADKAAPEPLITPPVVIGMHERSASLVHALILPSIDLTDPMKATLLNHHLIELEKRAMQGWFSFCPIRDIAELGRVSLIGEAAEAFELLRKLHCIKFCDMHPEVAKQVVSKINTVFAGGVL